LAEVKLQEGETLENALRRFKRKVQQEDIIKEVKRHSFYLKPGEKGAPVDIKDARYVMFRIPGAAVSAGSGKTVLDSERHKARTAYVNAPLAPSSDNAPPDERQLVPPRYRDMIH